MTYVCRIVDLFKLKHAVYIVDLQLNPFTREVDEIGRSYDKRYDDDNVYGRRPIRGVREN